MRLLLRQEILRRSVEVAAVGPRMTVRPKSFPGDRFEPPIFLRFNFFTKPISVHLPYEDSDRRGRAFAPGGHATCAAAGRVRGRDGRDLCRGGQARVRIRLRLHPARHHATRRQWAATARADQRAAPQGERDHRVGSRTRSRTRYSVWTVARTTILPSLSIRPSCWPASKACCAAAAAEEI